jgi:uridine kinase
MAIMSLTRVLDSVAHDIYERVDEQQGLIVAIDGPDGAGKSTFAENLSTRLRQDGTPVIHTSVDGFHRLRKERYVKGQYSPEGFFRDSYDYEKLKEALLIPFKEKNGQYIKTAVHDVETDEQLSPEPVHIQPGTVLIIDGIFLHRDEIVEYWDYSIFLDVDFEQTFRRMAKRDNTSPDPHDEKNRRYYEGQLLYFRECSPKSRATIVIDNNDFENPKIIQN